MAKKSVLERNLKRLQLSTAHAKKRLELKKQIKDKSLPLKDRVMLAQKLDSMPIDGSKSRYRNRCCVTGRGRGVVHKSLGICRIILRELVAKGQIAGIRKASW